MADSITDAMALQHLFVLCCYGGAPFIDYFATTAADSAKRRHVAVPRMIDPTDWMASDMSGSLLNATLHPQFVIRHPQLMALIPRADSGIELDACDLYNLTFSSAADENLFHRFHGVFACRCLPGRFGHSCEYAEEAQADRNNARRRSSSTTPTTTITSIIATNSTTQRSIESKRKTTTLVTEKLETKTRNRTTRTSSSVASTLHNDSKIGRRMTSRLPYVSSTVPTSSLQSELFKRKAKAIPTAVTKKLFNASDTTKNSTFAPYLSLLRALGVALTATPLNCSIVNCTTNVPTVNETIAAAMSLAADGVDAAQWTFSTYLLVFSVLMLAMVGCCRLMRGCFCDCFGGFKNPFAVSERYDAPVDVNALQRCIDAVNAYEQSEKNKYVAETRRPLISSISETCPPYNPTVISAHDAVEGGTMPHNGLALQLPQGRLLDQQQQQQSLLYDRLNHQQQFQQKSQRSTAPPRTHSPPPSYHSSTGSLNVR